jgi:hypothetical protein
MKEVNIEDVKRITDLTNKYMDDFFNILNPEKYKNNEEIFIHTCMTSPCCIGAEIIDKLSKTLGVDRQSILKVFIEKLELSIRWVDSKSRKD